MALQQEAERIMSSIERKGWEKGRSEGRAEGLAEGLAEGQRKTLLRMVPRQLQVKFGEVPVEDRALLEKLSDDRLEELIVAVLTAGSYADWREQLQKLSQDTN